MLEQAGDGPSTVVVATYYGLASRRPSLGFSVTATDADGDRISAFESGQTPNGIIQTNSFVSSPSNVPGAHQNGAMTFAVENDLRYNSTAYDTNFTPSSIFFRSGRRNLALGVRARDSRGARSSYRDHDFTLWQPVFGNIDRDYGFRDGYDRRLPMAIYLSKANSNTETTGAGDYQYANEEAAYEEESQWPGSMQYWIGGFLHSRLENDDVLYGVDCEDPDLDCVFDADRQRVTLTPKATAATGTGPGNRRVSNGARTVFSMNLGARGHFGDFRRFTVDVLAYVYIAPTPPPTVDIDINGSDGPVTITAGDTVVLNLRATNHSLVEFRSDVGAVIGDWTTVTDPSDPYSADVPLTPTFADLTEPATWIFHLRVTGANGDVITDSVVLNILTSTTDSPWSSLVEFDREATTDSEWSSLVEFDREATTDSEWSSLVEFDREATTDSDWSGLVEFPRATANRPPVCAPPAGPHGHHRPVQSQWT